MNEKTKRILEDIRSVSGRKPDVEGDSDARAMLAQRVVDLCRELSDAIEVLRNDCAVTLDIDCEEGSEGVTLSRVIDVRCRIERTTLIAGTDAPPDET